MHLSDCLGGYCFYDQEFRRQLEEPRLVIRGSITDDAFDSEKQVMEINSKSGLYPLYCAYSIYRKRLGKMMAQPGGKEESILAKSLWDATIENNIFVVCKTPMAVSITRRTLAGFRDIKVNAIYYRGLVERISVNQDAVVSCICDGKSFWNKNDSKRMKFNLIVGNPPYQNQTTQGGIQATPIYNYFVDLAKKIKPNYLSMITPSRWFAGGMGLDDFRESMIKDKKLMRLVDFVNAKDCFPTISISGGVSYFLWNNKHNGECIFESRSTFDNSSELRSLEEFPVLIRYNKAVDIVRKVLLLHEESLSGKVSAISPFALPTSIRGEAKEMPDSVKLYTSKGVFYISENTVKKGEEWRRGYKVLVSQTGAEHAMEPSKDGTFKVLTSTMQVLSASDVCTHSYILIGTFSTREEAENLLQYLKTKFVRFLILQCVSSIHISRSVFRFVPMQDFSHSWTDKDLYAKYNLTNEEIKFIDSLIKPMQ